MENKDGKYRCPKCGVEAVIEGRNIHVYVQLTTTHGGYWPPHPDCEYAKTIDDIDVSKLERIS